MFYPISEYFVQVILFKAHNINRWAAKTPDQLLLTLNKLLTVKSVKN